MTAWGKEWGRYRLPDGRIVSMQRGKRNRVRFFDVETGEQVGPEQSNVYPAMVFASYSGWWDIDASAAMNLGMVREAREQSK
jgi:hypothetical protein